MTFKGQKDPDAANSFGLLSTLGGEVKLPGRAAEPIEQWESLTHDQARTLRTVCDRIIPEDDFPSASQAGVLAYIDQQLAGRYRNLRDAYREGLEAVETISRKLFSRDISWLSSQHQTMVLAEFQRQNKKIFDMFRSHTVEGYYGPQRNMKATAVEDAQEEAQEESGDKPNA